MTDSNALSFARDIRPLFTEIDVDHMKQFDLDLTSRDQVAESAKNILFVVKAGTMPPPSSGERWSQEMCETFGRWMDQGCPP